MQRSWTQSGRPASERKRCLRRKERWFLDFSYGSSLFSARKSHHDAYFIIIEKGCGLDATRENEIQSKSCATTRPARMGWWRAVHNPSLFVWASNHYHTGGLIS